MDGSHPHFSTDEELDEPVECEVCLGRHGESSCTVTLKMDSAEDETPVRMCRECVSTLLDSMTAKWQAAIAANNAEVKAVAKMLGLEWLASE